jgi:hypothetical protein
VIAIDPALSEVEWALSSRDALASVSAEILLRETSANANPTRVSESGLSPFELAVP